MSEVMGHPFWVSREGSEDGRGLGTERERKGRSARRRLDRRTLAFKEAQASTSRAGLSVMNKADLCRKGAQGRVLKRDAKDNFYFCVCGKQFCALFHFSIFRLFSEPKGQSRFT